jgi:hypothetical protein
MHKNLARNLKRSLGRPECRWKDNIEMNLKEIGLEDTDRIYLAQDGDR